MKWDLYFKFLLTYGKFIFDDASELSTCQTKLIEAYAGLLSWGKIQVNRKSRTIIPSKALKIYDILTVKVRHYPNLNTLERGVLLNLDWIIFDVYI